MRERQSEVRGSVVVLVMVRMEWVGEVWRDWRMAVMREGDSRAGISLEPRSSMVEWERVAGSWRMSILDCFWLLGGGGRVFRM